MKVMLLTTHLRPGGITVYTVLLANSLAGKGHDLTVVSSGGEFTNMLASGIEHVQLDIDTKCEFGLKALKGVRPVLELLKERDVEIMHAQTRVAQVLGSVARKMTGVPLVTTCHGFYRHRRLSRRLFPCWGDGVVAISKGVARHLIEDMSVPEDRLRQIYNGIDLTRFEQPEPEGKTLRETLVLPEGSFVIGSVGRLSEVKGYTYLIDACAELREGKENVFLLLVGEGRARGQLEKRARASALADAFRIVAPEGDPAPYFRLMDVFCLPSLKEGLGLSVMEAMAAGKACVASDIPGLKELIVEGRDGLLVRQGDPHALARAIGALMRDAGLRDMLGTAARAKALNEFGIDVSAERTAAFYDEILKKDAK